jgi:hypothetical protein
VDTLNLFVGAPNFSFETAPDNHMTALDITIITLLWGLTVGCFISFSQLFIIEIETKT